MTPQGHQEGSRVYQYDPFLRGSSRWATKEGLASRGYGENGDTFLGYGMAEHNRASAFPVTLNSEIHLIVKGETRSSKGVSFIMPHCFYYQGMLIVLDVKGGQIAKTAIQVRQALGRKVVVLGDDDIAKILNMNSSGFDVIGKLDPKSDRFFDDAHSIAEAIVMENKKDPHWSEEARDLIAGLCMYIRICNKLNLPVPEKGNTLNQLRVILNLPKTAFMEVLDGKSTKQKDGSLELVKRGMQQSRHEKVRDASSRMMNKNEKEFGAILSTATSNTKFLESNNYARTTSKADIDIAEIIARGDTDIFCVISPKNIKQAKRMLRLLVNEVIKEVQNLAAKPKKNIHLILEEFCSVIGYMSVLEDAFGITAGLGLILIAVIQSYAQLRNKYPDSFEDIIGNSNQIITSSNNNFDCEYISKTCGTTTIEQLTESSVAKRYSIACDPNFASTQDKLESRALITPSEIRTLHPTLMILILRGCHPALVYGTLYYLDKMFRDNKDKPIYGIDPDHADKPIARSIDFTKRSLDIEKALEPYVIKNAVQR